MMVESRTAVLPERALFRQGLGAFRGSYAPDSNPIVGGRIETPSVERQTFHVSPPAMSDWGNPNRLRLGIPLIAEGWAKWRTRMSGEVFIRQRIDVSTPRRQVPPRVLGAVVANRRAFYDAPEYGTPANSDFAARRRCAPGRGFRR